MSRGKQIGNDKTNFITNDDNTNIIITILTLTIQLSKITDNMILITPVILR